MEDELQNIKLKIGAIPLEFPVDRCDEKYYRQAGVYINSKFLRLRKSNPKVSNEMLMSIVAVELGVELKKKDGEFGNLLNDFEDLDNNLNLRLK